MTPIKVLTIIYTLGKPVISKESIITLGDGSFSVLQIQDELLKVNAEANRKLGRGHVRTTCTMTLLEVGGKPI